VTSVVESRFPEAGPVEVSQLLHQLRQPPPGGPLTVGDPRVVEFLIAFARRLLAPATARRYPELASLGFFLRRSEIDRALGRVVPQSGVLRFPRGLVFHVPPANVDTIFVYSWALSALAGNHNVVRISARSAGAADVVLAALQKAATDAHPAVAATQRLITYGREDEVTAAFSSSCDLRVIWGGDRAVSEIRRHPVAPHARDLTFPDRSSFAVLSVEGWQAADDAARQDAVIGFANDSYWFDQNACASPRAVYWVGPADGAQAVRDEFFSRLAQVVAERHFAVDTSMAVEKIVATYGLAINDVAATVQFDGNGVAVATLRHPALVPRRWLGAGTFPECRVESLSALVEVVTRKDQTLAAFGFTADELTRFVEQAGHRGIDRVVPFGSALSFDAIWDGYDLIPEFSRLTTVRTA
jgi:hypothetical protein